MTQRDRSCHQRLLSRRQFLKAAGATAAGALLFGSSSLGRPHGSGCTLPWTGQPALFPRRYDFMARFGEAQVETPDPAYVVAGDMVPVAGEGRFGLFAHAPTQITYPAVPLYEEGRLQFGVGLHQEAWGRPGDGVRFALEVRDEAGQVHRLYERHLNPYRRPQDRAWFDETVDLADLANQRVQVTFRTEAVTNNQNDWAVWSGPHLRSWEHRTPAGRDERPNVLLITLDTLRADHVSCYGYPRQTSPTLDRLAQEGVRFAHAYSHSEYTTPSHLTMLTGLYPRSHGVINNHIPAPEDLLTLPERLQGLGYHTAGAVSVYHLGPSVRMDQGFTDFFSCEAERRKGGETADLALQWLDGPRREPFFLWVHYFDPHAEYLPPYPYNLLYDASPPYAPYRLPMEKVQLTADWAERYGDWPMYAEDVAEVIAQYDGAIAYTDAQVARLLARLEQQGLDDRTVVIVTADHGEGFGEHGVAFDHYGLYEEMVHVPLIVRAPGRLPAGQVVEDLVGHVDLGPTLLDMLDQPIPKEMPGHSLVPLMEGRRWRGHEGIVSQQRDDLSLGLRTAGWRMILQKQDDDAWPLYQLQAGVVELYDLEADPGEEQNLAPVDSAALRKREGELSERLLKWQRDTPLAATGEGELDEETEEMLRRLGY